MARSWASVIESGRLTWPWTFRRKLVTSTEVGITAQCHRTKNRSLGVNTPWSKTSIGVSSSGGRVRCRIMLLLPGKALVSGRFEGPPGRPRSTICSAQAGVARPAAPTRPAPRRKSRRLVVGTWSFAVRFMVFVLHPDMARGPARRTQQEAQEDPGFAGRSAPTSVSLQTGRHEEFAAPDAPHRPRPDHQPYGG